MASFLGLDFVSPVKRSVRPTETAGAPGTAVIGGYVVENEKTAELRDAERFRTFSEILANTSVVAAGVRYFLNLAAKSGWTFTPAEGDTDGKWAEMAEQILKDDPRTSWSRIVKRACMYRFYGFSVQEWTAKRREDGVITFKDVQPRPQMTIERWDVAPTGEVLGIVQRSPQTSEELYLPRGKVVYIVDDVLNDSPTGLGLFRHLVKPAKRLERFELLEQWGFENDLRGTPVGRAPYSEIREKVDAGQMTKEQAAAAVRPLEDFVKKHVKNPALGLLLDSMVYKTSDDAQTPSGTHKFGMDLLQGGSTTLAEVAASIVRINKELARVLGVEGIILGDGDAGSNALSRDKSNQLALTVDGTLEEVADGLRNDLLETAWTLNGFPEEMMPKLRAEAVAYRDVEQVTAALRDMATAGATLHPADPVVADVRAMLGVSPPDQELLDMEMALSEAGLKGAQAEADGLGQDDPEEDVKDPEEKP